MIYQQILSEFKICWYLLGPVVQASIGTTSGSMLFLHITVGSVGKTTVGGGTTVGGKTTVGGTTGSTVGATDCIIVSGLDEDFIIGRDFGITCNCELTTFTNELVVDNIFSLYDLWFILCNFILFFKIVDLLLNFFLNIVIKINGLCKIWYLSGVVAYK